MMLTKMMGGKHQGIGTQLGEMQLILDNRVECPRDESVTHRR